MVFLREMPFQNASDYRNFFIRILSVLRMKFFSIILSISVCFSCLNAFTARNNTHTLLTRVVMKPTCMNPFFPTLCFIEAYFTDFFPFFRSLPDGKKPYRYVLWEWVFFILSFERKGCLLVLCKQRKAEYTMQWNVPRYYLWKEPIC